MFGLTFQYNHDFMADLVLQWWLLIAKKSLSNWKDFCLYLHRHGINAFVLRKNVVA